MPIDIHVKRHITPRELQVLDLVCQGHSTKKIAGQLSISFKTAACHRSRLMEKAGVHDPISLFRWALLQGHVSVGQPHAPQGADHQLTQE
jgi:DNA-binding NarL/FixJ family response regulator